MSKRTTTRFLVAASAAALLAAAWAFAASPAASAPAAATKRAVPIVMAEPGCHWFSVAGKLKTRLTVHGKTTFRNLDEAALIFKGKNFTKRLAVGKSLTISKRGVYHITMVHQAPDDNHLRLVVK